MYLEYAEYVSLGGTVSTALYARLEYKACKKLDYYTQNRIQKLDEIPDSVKRCMVEVVELLAKSDTSEHIVQSESNAGVSVTYKLQSEQEISAKVMDAIREYLPPRLLYLGACV